MENSSYSAFWGSRLLTSGPLPAVITAAYPYRDNLVSPLLIFSHATGQQLDFDWRGSIDEAIERVAPATQKTGPGRPKLGVVSIEVTLLPRHWDWLNAQPARASGTLRRLVDQAIAQEAENPKKRWEALGKILWSVAGNEPDFEEATRALYAGDGNRLKTLSSHWSGDLPEFVVRWVDTLAGATP